MLTDMLREFVDWLITQEPDLNQSTLARRTGLSQGVVSKVHLGSYGRGPELSTFQAIVQAVPERWHEFLRKHPGHEAKLRRLFPLVRNEIPDAQLARLVRDLAELVAVAPQGIREDLLYDLGGFIREAKRRVAPPPQRKEKRQ